jgi:uncharacterized membrane protein
MSNTTQTTLQKQPISLYVGTVLTILSIIGVIFGFLHKSSTEVSSQDKLLIFSIIFLLSGLVILGAGIAKHFTQEPVLQSTTTNVIVLSQAALFAALAYIGFSYFRIDIPIGPGSTAFHLGNTFVVLAALLLGGPWGGLSGAVGLSLADLMSGKYFTTAPQTFFLKLFIGLIAGLVAHHIFKISKQKDPKKIFLGSVIASISGLAFNVIADPVVGFFYKKYILSLQTEVALDWSRLTAVTTFVNAVASVIASVILYNALRPALIKANLFVRK